MNLVRHVFPQPHSVLPDFGLALGYTLLYLSLLVLIPLSAASIHTATMGWPAFWAAVTSPRVLAPLKLSFDAAAIAASINGIFGLLVAWVPVRYRFPAERLVDLPR